MGWPSSSTIFYVTFLSYHSWQCCNTNWVTFHLIATIFQMSIWQICIWYFVIFYSFLFFMLFHISHGVSLWNDHEIPLLLCHVLVTSFVQFCNMNCVTFHWVCNKFSNENQQQFIFNDCESLLLFILYVLCYNCWHSSLEGLPWDVLATCKTFELDVLGNF